MADAEESELTRVWNRATTDAPPTRPGDQALHDALKVDGQIMNGGLLSALDYIDYDQIEQGAAGLEYLGMEQAAGALRSALSLAFPDGPVPADDREEYTLALPGRCLNASRATWRTPISVRLRSCTTRLPASTATGPTTFGPCSDHALASSAA
jgi:hypothetical protein